MSKHLGVLRKVGLVSVEKDGQRRLYRLNGVQLKAVYDWVKTFERFWQHHIDRIKERADARAAEWRLNNRNKRRSLRTPNRRSDPVQMTEQAISSDIQTLNLEKNQSIAAPVQIVWESILEELGPAGDHPQGGKMPMVLEAFPGGRWYRDTGNNTGHFWGHVQVIKPPKLLEICGPMFMSYPGDLPRAVEAGGRGEGDRLTLIHKAIGLLDPEHMKGVHQGWRSSSKDRPARRRGG